MSSFDVAMNERGQVKHVPAFSLIVACALCFTLVTYYDDITCTAVYPVPRYFFTVNTVDEILSTAHPLHITNSKSRVTTADGCVNSHRHNCWKICSDSSRLSPTCCEFRTHRRVADATQLDSCVASASAVCINGLRGRQSLTSPSLVNSALVKSVHCVIVYQSFVRFISLSSFVVSVC